MKSKEDEIQKHNLMATASVLWWEKEIESVTEAVQEIDEIIDCFHDNESNDHLMKEREILIGKFNYLFLKGRFEDNLLMSIERDYRKLHNVKKKRK
jgi:hypothetical protein